MMSPNEVEGIRKSALEYLAYAIINLNKGAIDTALQHVVLGDMHLKMLKKEQDRMTEP